MRGTVTSPPARVFGAPPPFSSHQHRLPLVSLFFAVVIPISISIYSATASCNDRLLTRSFTAGTHGSWNRHCCGRIQFIHGWDIGNVMMALALPEKITRLRKGSPLASLTADSELLKKHTTRFDQILAKILCTTMTSSVLSMFALMLAESFGIFE